MSETVARPDAKYNKLQSMTGLTSSRKDMERAWLIDELGGSIGYQNMPLNDLWMAYLTGQGYMGSLVDMRYEWLKAQGYSGSMADMWFNFWNSTADISIPLTQDMMSFGGMGMGSHTRLSDFTYVAPDGTLKYGRASRENLWVNSDPAPTLGSEELTDGQFDGDGSAWELSNELAEATHGWLVTGGQLIRSAYAGNTFRNVRQNCGLTIGEEYLVELDVAGISGSYFSFFNSSTEIKQITEAGSIKFVFTAVAGDIQLYTPSQYDIAINSFSVKEYTAPTGFEISNAYAIPYDWGISPNGNALENAVVFGDNSVLRLFRDNSIPMSVNKEYLLSFYVIMDDSSKPIADGTASSDFRLVVKSGSATDTASVSHITGNVYRVSAHYLSDNTGTYTCGIDKLVTYSSKGFKVTGFQVEELPSANTLGPELITDGDGSSDSFVTGIGWSYDAVNDEWDCNNTSGSNGNLTQAGAIPVNSTGKCFQVTFTVSNYSGVEKVLPNVGGYNSGEEVGGDGTYTQIIYVDAPSPNENFYLTARDGFVGSVDDISVREIPAWVVEHSMLGPELVTNGDFSDGETGWTISNPHETALGGWVLENGVAKATNDQPELYRNLNQSILTVDSYYFASFDIVDPGTNPNFWIYHQISAIRFINKSAGTYSFVFKADGTSFTFYNSNLGLTIDNVSVKQILDPSIQPSPYTETTDATALIPADNPIEQDGFAFMGSAAVNLISYSEDFSEWTAGAATDVEVADVLAPDGKSKCYKVTFTGTTTGTYIKYDATETGVEYNFSLFVKAVEGSSENDFRLRMTGTNVVDETFTATSSWQRIDISGTPNPTTDAGVYFDNVLNSDGEFYIFGAQLTEGPQLQPYIPTNGTPVAMMPTEDVKWTLSDKLKGILGDTVAAAAAGVDAGEGTLIVDLVPGYNSADKGTVGFGILTPADTIASLLYVHTAGDSYFASYDQTNVSLEAVQDGYLSGDTLLLAVRYSKDGNVLQYGHKHNDNAWDWDGDGGVSFDGAYEVSTDLLIGKLCSLNFHIKNIRIYKKAYTTTEIERLAA